jgi:hypothetical protein
MRGIFFAVKSLINEFRLKFLPVNQQLDCPVFTVLQLEVHLVVKQAMLGYRDRETLTEGRL